VNGVDEGVGGLREGIMKGELFLVSERRGEIIAEDEYRRRKYISNE
jgi:hypothetical protein